VRYSVGAVTDRPLGRAASTLIVDDELDMRTLIRLVIELKAEGFEVAGEAADGVEALEQWRELGPPPQPDIVVLDNRMPRMSGLEVAATILEQVPEQRIILYSAHLNDDVRSEAERLGIRRCMSKSEIQLLPEVLKEILNS